MFGKIQSSVPSNGAILRLEEDGTGFKVTRNLDFASKLPMYSVQYMQRFYDLIADGDRGSSTSSHSRYRYYRRYVPRYLQYLRQVGDSRS